MGLGTVVCLLLAIQSIWKTQAQTDFETATILGSYEDLLLPFGYIAHNIPLPPDATVALNDSESFPFTVFVSMAVDSIQEIDEMNQDLTLELEITMVWFDHIIGRFSEGKFPDPSRLYPLSPSFLERIWQPDLIFEHAITIEHPHLNTLPKSLRFQPNVLFNYNQRKVLLFQYTTRVLLKVNCEMDFQYYPADTQVCPIRLRSFGFVTSQLRLDWLRIRPVELRDQGDPNYYLQINNVGIYKKVADIKLEDTYYYDVLKLDVLAKRKIEYHLCQTYLPSIFFIVLTWMCFLLPSRMIEARIGIAMTTLLTLTAMFASVRESSPTASYVKALDVWMVGCILYVFITLFQFVFLVWIKELDPDHGRMSNGTDEVDGKVTPSEDIIAVDNGGGGYKVCTVEPRVARIRNIGTFLEKHSFWLSLPICVGFFIVYWCWLLLESGYTKWDVDARYNPISEN